MITLASAEVRARLERLEIPFDSHGYDPFGVGREDLARFFTFLELFYRHYFDVHLHGIEHVPDRGRCMVVGNHSGGFAVDAGMIIASMFFDREPPRLAQGMADKFLSRLPFASPMTQRIGQHTGLPEHAVRLLEADRLLLVFPEGARGTAKLYVERDTLVRFGTGFVRLALQTRSPIVPAAFVGGGEAVPTIFNAYRLGARLGVPYIPVTPYLLPVPLPVRFDIVYGEPIALDGDGNETDEVIQGYTDLVKKKIAELIALGRTRRNQPNETGPSETRPSETGPNETGPNDVAKDEESGA